MTALLKSPSLRAPLCSIHRFPALQRHARLSNIAAGPSPKEALHTLPAAMPYFPEQRQSVKSRSAASSAPQGSAPGGSAPEDKGAGNMLLLGGLFAGWYGANIVFNIYNKTVLKVVPCPLTCTALQFVMGSLVALLCWATGVVARPKFDGAMLRSVFPLAVVHTLGNLLTNVSLGAVAVSFTHTIKALEPLFSVLLSSLFLGDTPHPAVLLTLVPIVGGVGLASMAEASFNWIGFLSAMGSNLTFQSRNVLSKKLMVKKDGLGNINLFSIITIMSALLLVPVALLMEGVQLSPSALAARGVAEPWQLIQQAALAGLCFHMYQQVSYMILQRVTPVTHSIGNCVKRVIVIVASVIAFNHPVSQQNAIGTAVALAGVFAYSQAKRITTAKPKTA